VEIEVLNRARVAALLRQLANEFEPDAPANDAPKGKRLGPLPLVRTGLPTDLDRQVARQELRRLGYRAGGKR
jgi:hypothetical protein